MQPKYQIASPNLNMVPPADKTNVADRARSSDRSKSTQQKYVPRYEEGTFTHQTDVCTLCPDDYQSNHDHHTQAISALSVIYPTKYMGRNYSKVPQPLTFQISQITMKTTVLHKIVAVAL